MCCLFEKYQIEDTVVEWRELSGLAGNNQRLADYWVVRLSLRQVYASNGYE